MASLGNTIKATGANVAFSAAFKYLEKDPVKNFPKLMKWADTFTKGNSWNKAVGRFQNWFDEETWQGVLIKRVLQDCNTTYLKKFILNFFLNSGVKGMPIARAKSEELGVNVPWAILMDPTSACNLKCVGCWAAEYGKHYNLSYEKMDEIITQGKELGVYFYIYSGGEPLVRKKDLIRLAEKHNDCAFGAFTNATLIDEDFVEDLLRVGNFTFMISAEGNKEETDSRRGEGTYDAVKRGMKLLKDARIPFGFSGTYTSKNYQTISSDEWINEMIDDGCLFGWLFTYMPIGSGADVSLCVTPEQRAHMYKRVREMREYKPIFLLDFWNDGEYVGGCIAGGRRYFHINSNGDCEPCAFIHYATHNINECTLEEALGSPLFKKYQEGQPFSDNLLQPCPLLDNPEKLRQIVSESGAKPTQDLDLEGVDVLTAKTDPIAAAWKPVADQIWSCGHYPHNAIINHALQKRVDLTCGGTADCGNCGRIKVDRPTEKPAHIV
ncbi:radical SAM protein [Christensenellaceae bacterium OttesenSCG-928-K19]|nr:radical SAM protein [Christensenellaceae bacterium OttesenSCG-928-K19]